jgi:predicted aspartyl protease
MDRMLETNILCKRGFNIFSCLSTILKKAYQSKIILLFSITLIITSFNINSQSNKQIKRLATTHSFTNQNDWIVLDSVGINNSENHNTFVFDTGSEYCVIDEKLANRLSLNFIKQTKVVDASGKVKIRDIVSIDTLQIFGNLFFNILATIIDLSQYSCEQISGIIGNNVIQQATWQIDFPDNKITLFPSSQNGFTIPLIFKSNNLPYIKLKSKKRSFDNFLFDTGNRQKMVFCENDLKYFKASAITSQYFYLEKSLNANEFRKKITKETLIRSYNIGEITIDSCFAIFNGKNRVIGNSLFSKSIITINYPEKKIIVSRKEISFNRTVNPSGLNLGKNQNGDIYISQIRKNSNIEKSGLKVGDIILSINGLKTHSIKDFFCEKRLLYEMINKDTLDIVLIKTGEHFIIFNH